MATRILKIVLALSAAAWGIVGGLRNLYDYQNTIEFTTFLLSVEGRESIRAITFPLFAHFSYAFVWGSKFITAALCILGAIELWKTRSSPASEFAAAKEKIYLGIGIAIFMLFFGFMVMVGALFAPFEITEIRTGYSQYATFQLVGLGMIMMFLALPERDV
ncbi:MAG: DUF2165 family protein [Pseudomonadales bacterium]|nr:DUF2165 family protein [Pseudomonadales bacterium]